MCPGFGPACGVKRDLKKEESGNVAKGAAMRRFMLLALLAADGNGGRAQPRYSAKQLAAVRTKYAAAKRNHEQRPKKLSICGIDRSTGHATAFVCLASLWCTNSSGPQARARRVTLTSLAFATTE